MRRYVAGLLSTLVSVFILLEAGGALAFCETNPVVSGYCHKQLVQTSLSFLRPWILNHLLAHINDTDHHPLGWGYASDDHFDACNFDGGVDRINGRYLSRNFTPLPGVVPALTIPLIYPAMETWAKILHASQDFYAHSNWVEMGFTLGERDLVDSGSGPWRSIPSNWGLVREGVLASQEDLPSGWRMRFEPANRRVPIITGPDGKEARLLISGVEAGNWATEAVSQHCPKGARLDHDDVLNKDKWDRPYHDDAALMARFQTAHEWCRLLSLMWSTGAPNGAAARASLAMGLLVRPDASPHPAGSTCAARELGPSEVLVRVTLIRVLNDYEDDGAGQINFVLTLFTEDFRRSTRVQTGTVKVQSGQNVPSNALPKLVSLCVNPSDKLVVTLQGWEDDGSSARGELNEDDDLLSGVTRRFAPGSATHTETIALSSDNPNRKDLTVGFSISTLPPGVTKVCPRQQTIGELQERVD